MDLVFAALFSRAGLLVMALTAAFYWHQHDKAAAIKAFTEKATLTRRAEIATYLVSLSERNLKLIDELKVARGNIRIETKTIVKEVNRYVTPLADSRCAIPDGFVRHFDASWGLSPLSASPGGLVDNPSGVSLSRVETVNSENAGAAREWKSEALGWRKWYTDNKSQYDKFNGRIAKQTP